MDNCKKCHPLNLRDDLYSFQREDSLKMSSYGNFLNLSEMGLGKTPETLAVIEGNKYGCILIVVPNSLKLEWKRQIDDWVGEGNTAVTGGDLFSKMGPIVNSFRNGQKYKVINYESLRNKQLQEMLSLIPWDCIIFDEIHKIRNPKTKLTPAIWTFLNQYPNTKILGLSGSPIMNYPNDLFVPLSIIQPERWPRNLRSFNQFMYNYCYWSDGKYGSYVYGTRNLGTLREETSPYIIRRLKKDVLKDLPDKYYRRVHIQMQPDQRKLYKEMETELRILLDSGEPLWSTNVLTTLTRLRQLNLDPNILGRNTTSAKTDFIRDLVDPLGEKLVIFSCFETYIELLSQIFSDIPHIKITGKVKVEDRQAQVKKFQEDPSIKLCLGTVQTMGEGLTLTAASTVILMDRWWNEPTNSQAVDRLHRIGQKSAVQVIFPICEDSMDEVLDEILQKKYSSSQEYYQETEVRSTVLEVSGLRR